MSASAKSNIKEGSSAQSRFKKRQWAYRAVAGTTLLAVSLIVLPGDDPAKMILAIGLTGTLIWLVGVWVASFDPSVKKDDLVIVLPHEAGPKLSPPLDKLMKFVEEKNKYPFDAYLAVIAAIRFVPERLQFEPLKNHITAGELTRRFVHYVAHEFQAAAQPTMKEWCIQSPKDIGEIVFDMAGLGLLAIGPDDKLADFSQLPAFSVRTKSEL